MAYKRYDGYDLPASGQDVSPTWAQALLDGLQAEHEERMEAWALNGIESGCAPSIVGTTISIATGVMWVEGCRHEPAPSVVAFTAGDSANTYYVYVDPTDHTSPYKKATSDPGAGYLVVCSVAWDGASVLSGLVDLSPWGIETWSYQVNVVGAISADTIAFLPLAYNVWIDSVLASLETCGTAAGPSYIDVHGGAGGSEATIFTTQARRPTIAHDGTDGAVYASGVPDGARKFSAGQKLLVIVDAAATNAADLGVTIKGRRYN